MKIKSLTGTKATINVENKKRNRKTSFQTLGLNYYYDRSEENYAELFKELYHPLYWRVFKILNDQDQALDVVSQIFEKIVTQIDKFKPEKAQFSTWIFTIANNDALNYIYHRDKWNKVDADVSDLYDTHELADEEDHPLSISTTAATVKSYHKDDVLSLSAKRCLDILEMYKDEQVIKLTKCKLTTDITFKDLAKKYKISMGEAVRSVNKGKEFIKENFMNNKDGMYDLYKEAIKKY